MPNFLKNSIKYLRRVYPAVATKESNLSESLGLLGFGPNDLRPYFDREFYLEANPDVAVADTDPFEHYLSYGWKEGREPFPQFFSTLQEYQVGSLSSEFCPLSIYAIYIRGGLEKPPSAEQKEEVSSSDGNDFLLGNSESDKQPALLKASPLGWYREEDQSWSSEILSLLRALGQRTTQLEEIPIDSYIRNIFDPNFVRDRMGMPDEVSDNECFVRYIISGLLDGMPPGPFFHEATYRRHVQNSKLPPIGKNEAFTHFLKYGINADISPSPLFSSEDYIQLNRDLISFPGSKLLHFVKHGLVERRQFSSLTTIAHGNSDDLYSGSHRFISELGDDERAHAELEAASNFKKSLAMIEIVSDAHSIDPLALTDMEIPSYVAPWHDRDYLTFKEAITRIPDGEFDAVVLIPFCKVGGSDYVAGTLSRSLGRLGERVLVVQTDQADWHRPDWFGDASRLDLSALSLETSRDKATRLLYEVIRTIRPKNVFNVNSRLAFESFDRFGRQLKTFTNLHAYYFCADRTPKGDEVGYPVWYFSTIFDYLSTAITDSKYLSNTLTKRFTLKGSMADRVACIYTPLGLGTPQDTLAELQIASSANRRQPRVMWAGRFDAQKRFDLFLDVAREMPDVNFCAWGKAVLDPPPDLSDLPKNVELHDPFINYDELPLEEVDGLLYTSDWDGVPTILIELGGLGMPIVASVSGGVTELIDDKTGWPVPVGSTAKAYAHVIKTMLSNTEQRCARSKALKNRVHTQHSKSTYDKRISGLLK